MEIALIFSFSDLTISKSMPKKSAFYRNIALSILNLSKSYLDSPELIQKLISKDNFDSAFPDLSFQEVKLKSINTHRIISIVSFIQ
jgi:hypothetical protein